MTDETNPDEIADLKDYITARWMKEDPETFLQSIYTLELQCKKYREKIVKLESRWISDVKPIHGQTCWGYHKGSNSVKLIFFCYPNHWWEPFDIFRFELDEITHWMPYYAPEPPEIE